MEEPGQSRNPDRSKPVGVKPNRLSQDRFLSNCIFDYLGNGACLLIKSLHGINAKS